MSLTPQKAPKVRYDCASAIWITYHKAQMIAFDECFKDMPYGRWKRDQVLEELKLVCPRLSAAKKINAKNNLQSAIKFRTMMLLKFPYSTEKATARHRDSIHLLKEMKFLLREEPINERQFTEEIQVSLDLETDSTGVDGDSNKSFSRLEITSSFPKTEAQDTMEEDAIHTFIQSLSVLVEEICSSWRRAKEDLEISCATADATWLFRTFSATIASTFCTSPTFFTTLHDKSYHFHSAFLEDLDSARGVNNHIRNGQRDTKATEAKYIQMIIRNAMKQPRGSMPFLHGLVVKLSNFCFLDGPSESEYEFRSFEANTCTLLLLRLRDQWDIRQLLSLKSSLAPHFERLEMVSSDIQAVQVLRKVATSALDISTIGGLSMLIETNIQRLLCQTMGTPLVTVVAHLHVTQSLQDQASGMSSAIDRICVKFAHLLFWNGKPKTVGACKESLRNWVLDSEMRTIRKGRSDFFEKLFQSRNKTPPLVRTFEALLEREELSTAENRVASDLSMSSTSISRFQEDIRDFQAVSLLLKAIKNAAEVESVGCDKSMELAFTLGSQLLEGHASEQFLTGVVENFEKFLHGT